MFICFVSALSHVGFISQLTYKHLGNRACFLPFFLSKNIDLHIVADFRFLGTDWLV